MASETDKTYEQIPNPYNDYLLRDQTLASPATAAGANLTTVQPPLGTPADPTASSTGQFAGSNGNVETQPVKSEGGMSDLWINKFIRSANWQPKSVGFFIDGLTGYAEFTNVFISGVINALSGLIGGWRIGSTSLTSGAGTSAVGLDSSGGIAIYAGNATPASAPFRVYSNGDVYVNSLFRNDFEWQTMFESLDSFPSYVSGTGVNSNVNGLIIQTGAASGSNAGITRTATSYASSPWLWTKKRRIKTTIKMLDSTTTLNAYILTGSFNSSIDNHFGFKLVDDYLYATNADGSTEKSTSLLNYGQGTLYQLDAIFVPGESVKYYINSALVATHTVNLPSGNLHYERLMDIKITNSSASDRRLLLDHYNIWVEG